MTKYFMGVDLGSTTAKTVVLDDGGNVVGARIVQMGAVSREGLRRSIDGALQTAGLKLSDVSFTIGTGYGRRLVPGVGRTFTEITCHARGVAAICPGVRLIIDIGGQDSKVIAVDETGLVEKFAMNDRCASGTGRFYEVLARALECDISEIGELAMQGGKERIRVAGRIDPIGDFAAGGVELEVSSMCATFAETEIISLLAEGAERQDVAAAVHRAIAHRALGLVAQVGKRASIVMTGGVAKNKAAVYFLSQALDSPVKVPPDPQITGAYGAALLALESSGERADGNDGDLTMLEAVEREVEAAFVPANRPIPLCTNCSGKIDSVALGERIPVRQAS